MSSKLHPVLELKHKSDFEFTKDTPEFALTGELWGICCILEKVYRIVTVFWIVIRKHLRNISQGVFKKPIATGVDTLTPKSNLVGNRSVGFNLGARSSAKPAQIYLQAIHPSPIPFDQIVGVLPVILLTTHMCWLRSRYCLVNICN